MPDDEDRPATFEKLWRESTLDSLRTSLIVDPDERPPWVPLKLFRPVMRNPLSPHPLAIFGPHALALLEPAPEPEPGPYTCTFVTMLPICIPNREPEED